jgi:hypothetical protein
MVIAARGGSDRLRQADFVSEDDKCRSIPRIGILSPVTEEGMREWWNGLRRGLGKLGYVEGKNIEFVWLRQEAY